MSVRVVAEHDQRIAHLLLADRVPFRHFELARSFLLDLERILQRMHLLHVGRIVRIDQRPHPNEHVARADFFPGDRCA